MPGAAIAVFDMGCCVQADNIATIIKAANVTVDPYWPGLFAKLFEKTSIDDLLSNIGSGERLQPPPPPFPPPGKATPPSLSSGCLGGMPLLNQRIAISSWTASTEARHCQSAVTWLWASAHLASGVFTVYPGLSPLPMQGPLLAAAEAVVAAAAAESAAAPRLLRRRRRRRRRTRKRRRRMTTWASPCSTRR